MSSIALIISDLEFARAELLQSIEGLSNRELTEVPLYEGWTVKDVLAHLIGWDQRTLSILPLMVENRAEEITGVEVAEANRAAAAAWRAHSLAEVLAEMERLHRAIIDFIAPLDHVEIDLRRERHGRIITIRSYILNIMTDHERRHAAEIEQWRKELEGAINPEALQATLAENRAAFSMALSGLNGPAVLDKTAVGSWSVKDILGHLTVWEERMLLAARHIYDPSLPGAPPLGASEDEWNELMVARRSASSWQQELQAWRATGEAVDTFVATLKPADWKLRGPYPWPDDQGTLAELLNHMAAHYADHLPALQLWQKKCTNPALKMP